MVSWNPFDWGKDWAEQALQDIFLHFILPIILVLLAVATLIFAPMRLRWKLLFIIIFLGAAAYLWGLIPWVS
jgi:hypothetical protein